MTSSDTAPVIDDPANSQPVFREGATATRYVEEDHLPGETAGRTPVEDISRELAVTDEDPNAIHAFTLKGADASYFDIEVGANGGGHLMTKARLDYETRNTYTVVVTADDGSGEANATASITVTIEVKDLDEKPEILCGWPGHLRGDQRQLCGERARTPWRPTRPPGPAQIQCAGFWEATTPMTSRTRVLARPRCSGSTDTPDYEAPADADGDNIYELTLEANDGTYKVSRTLSVAVTNVDELGTLSGDASLTYAESRTDAVGTYEITGGDGSTIDWSLEGADAGELMLDGTGMSRTLVFGSAPDFETPADDGGDNSYMVTIKAEAGGEEEMVEVSITVTNDEEPGTVDLSTGTAVVGTEVTASLSDEDGGITNMTWQWASADAMDGTFVDISGETSDSYTPVEGDVDMYLRVTVTYDDVHGGQTADSDAVMVSADAVAGYDRDDALGISATELSVAINDYLSGELDPVVLSEVIDAYLNG